MTSAAIAAFSGFGCTVTLPKGLRNRGSATLAREIQAP
jgi:hypothetical protein